MAKKPDEEAAALVAAAVVVALILVVAIPIGYVVKVLVKTGSPYLLGASLVLLVVGVLALATTAAWLHWLALGLLVATLVIARIEEVRLETADPDPEGFPLPFEGYRW